MPPKRETKTSPPFLLNSVDSLGRKIDPAVLSVAQEIGPRSVSYAEKLLGDPARALNFFEQAAATVSEAIKQKRSSGSPSVRNLAAYLFRTFIRIVGKARRKEEIFEESLRKRARSEVSTNEAAKLETAVLVDELMASCGKVAREITFRRLEGFSWKEIGKEFGISAHAAELRFEKCLEQARRTLRKTRQKG
jgi:DNA-directed RNA polymerase specialized sigma24 family protein